MYKMIITLSLLLTALACSNKTKQNSKPYTLSILSDHSDRMPIYPSIDWMKPLKDWQTLKKVNVLFEHIDDLPFHNKALVTLDLKTGLFSNELENKKALNHFFDTIEQEIQQQNQQPKSSPQSVIFPILANHLNQGVDEVHLFSDIKENSFTQLQRFKTAEALAQYKQELIHAFSTIPIKAGSTKIYIYYIPNNYEEGVYIQAIVSLYKEILQPKGYEVFMGQGRQIATVNTQGL